MKSKIPSQLIFEFGYRISVGGYGISRPIWLVARNQKDSLKGHFWESRFGSELLLNYASILARMIYVDLNRVEFNWPRVPVWWFR